MDSVQASAENIFMPKRCEVLFFRSSFYAGIVEGTMQRTRQYRCTFFEYYAEYIHSIHYRSVKFKIIG
ncbi:MAG: hypothetical protein OJF51_004993 [Nitrospira sp.]|nr:MAG: hypothetical protein OJF51_004993 [Nitrospira sp.]